MNSATLSGFDVSPGVGGLNDFGQWTALLLIIGGSLFTMIVGGLAVIRIARLPFTDGELILAAFLVEAAALLVGTSLLWNLSDSDHSPFHALFLAASSFRQLRACISPICPSQFPIHAIVLPLTILGGLGLPVLMELWCAIVFRAKLSAHSKSVIVVFGMDLRDRPDVHSRS